MSRQAAEGAVLDAASPARYGACLNILAGAVMFAIGLYFLFASDMPIALSIAFLVGGFLETVLGWFAIRRSRAAWAFACSFNGSASVVLLFGAPKVRDSFEISIGAALLPSFVFGILLVFFVLGRHDF